MAKVSILLTCYNHLSFLPAAVEGVMAQDHKDWEIIAIDDGSQDGSREWLTQNLPNAKLIFNEKNLGTYGALNKALESATGEFIAVLNDDDVWKPTKLSQQLALFENDLRIGLVHTNGDFIDGKGEVTPGNPLGFSFPRTETGDVLLALVYANKIIASAVLVRRQCFEELGTFNEAYFGSGDWEMWYRIAEKWDVGYVDEPVTQYRVHGTNASHKLDKIWRDDQMLREWIAPRLSGYKGRFSDHELRQAESHNWACLGTVLTLNGDQKRGREAYLRSFKLTRRWQSLARWGLSFAPKKVFRRFL
ncbi:MAG: glycosyltransferase [Fimbriimonadaceae bacterium]|jgi:glycosyltransferase involved in cell wall biosynthesis|nr:glycosyltransferase [Fimbriimonadaceae bacterium]